MRRAFSIILLGILLGIFFKASLTSLADSRDFAVIYLSSKAWLDHVDPYKRENYERYWSESLGPPDKIPEWPSIYPVFTLPLISPITLINWSLAKIIWMVINCIAFFSVLGLLLSSARFHLEEPNGRIMCGAAMIFFPVWNAIGMGQPVLLAILFGLLSLREAESYRWASSGLLLALSLCIKANLGGIFVLYFLLMRQPKSVAWCCPAVLAFLSIGVLNLGLGNLSWISSWIGNLHYLTAEWATNQGNASSLNNIYLLNLHYPLYRWIGSEVIVNIIVNAIALSSCAVLVLLYCNKDKRGLEKLIILATLSVLVLLLSYHRLSDASVCLVLMILVLLLRGTQYKRYGKVLAYLMIPLFIPGPQILALLAKNEVIPRGILGSLWWNVLVMPHQIWSLVLISIVMLRLGFCYGRRNIPHAETNFPAP